ncbi:MAG TPA: hypothetical protein VLZ86_11030 [Gelidibacter sp.]|nr:hypothetical protein [Gelidibacter sp.]
MNITNVKYSSELPEDRLKQKMNKVFGERTSKFVGTFTGPHEFAAYDKWSVISWYVPNFKRKSAYIKGEILKSGKGTLIKMNIRPNTMLSIASILSVVIGIMIIIAAGSHTRFLIIGSFFVLVGVLYYSLGVFSRNRLRSNFEKILDLTKI